MKKKILISVGYVVLALILASSCDQAATELLLESENYTGASGEFFLSPDLNSEYRISFEDIDPDVDGSFNAKDTVIATTEQHTYFEISLEEK